MMNSDNHDYFDFATEDELPEEHSSKTKPCPFCSKPIAADSLFCLYCGEQLPPGKKNRWVVLAVIFVLIAFLVWVLI